VENVSSLSEMCGECRLSSVTEMCGKCIFSGKDVWSRGDLEVMAHLQWLKCVVNVSSVAKIIM